MTDTTTPRPVRPEDLFGLHFLHSATLSPDGQWVAYSVATHDADADADYEQIWLLEIATRQRRQLTYGKHRHQAPQWSPDGKTLAFVSTRGEKPQIYLLPTDGGEARQLTQFKQGVSGGMAWSPDGQQLAFAPVPNPTSPMTPICPTA